MEKYMLPSHIIIFISITAASSGIFGLLYGLQLFQGLYIIHPFYTFMGLIGSVGLFRVGIASIKNWREWIGKNFKIEKL